MVYKCSIYEQRQSVRDDLFCLFVDLRPTHEIFRAYRGLEN